MADDRLTVLLIDDDEIDRQAVQRLVGEDFHLVEAATGAQGLELSKSNEADCVLLDYRLPDYDGLELINRLRQSGDTPVVMLTGQANEFVAIELVQRGAEDFLSKDVMSRESICRAVANAIEKASLRRELNGLREAVSSFVRAAEAAGLPDELAGELAALRDAADEDAADDAGEVE